MSGEVSGGCLGGIRGSLRCGAGPVYMGGSGMCGPPGGHCEPMVGGLGCPEGGIGVCWPTHPPPFRLPFRALFTYEGNSNDLRVAGSGGEQGTRAVPCPHLHPRPPAGLSTGGLRPPFVPWSFW